VHRDRDCLAAAVSRRAFPRALRVAAPVDVSALRVEIDAEEQRRATDPADPAGGRSEREQVDE
jgi:hypothetical protein